MSRTQTVTVEQKKLDDVADAYRAKGYTVTKQPSSDRLPSFLRSSSPDLIAQGDEESVVVQIKSSSQLQHDEEMEELAETIESEPGWRFELHVVPSDEPASEDILLSLQSLRARSHSVASLAKEGDEEEAFLLCWTITEALLRHLAILNEVALTDLSSGDVVKRLCMHGVIPEPVMETLIDAVYIRNRLVHGMKLDETVPLRALMKTANTLYQQYTGKTGEVPFDEA
jgi:uncharacterized protein YutE (UPF0331/DUF86 family)